MWRLYSHLKRNSNKPPRAWQRVNELMASVLGPYLNSLGDVTEGKALCSVQSSSPPSYNNVVCHTQSYRTSSLITASYPENVEDRLFNLKF